MTNLLCLCTDSLMQTAGFDTGTNNKTSCWLDTTKMFALCQAQTITPDPPPSSAFLELGEA